MLIFLYLFSHVVGIYVNMGTWAHLWWVMWRSKVNLRWHFSGVIHFALWDISFVGLEPLHESSWLTKEPQESICTHLPSNEIISTRHRAWLFYMYFAYMTSTLTTKLSPWSIILFLNWYIQTLKNVHSHGVPCDVSALLFKDYLVCHWSRLSWSSFYDTTCI